MRRRLLPAALGAAALSLLAVFTLPGVALAATTLHDGQWVIPTGIQPASKTYKATTTRPFWSVIMLSPGYIQSNDPVSVDYNMKVYNSTGTRLATTTFDPFEPDYVAIDGNIRSPRTYTARVFKKTSNYSGEQYRLVFVDGKSTVVEG